MNISDFTQQNILFLKGISLDDVISIEDMYQKELLTNMDSQQSLETIWDKIPKHFYGLESWKKNTNIRCWYCTLKFKTIPWFIIENTNHTANGLVYDIKGNFCSCGCLMGYVKSNYTNRDHFDIYKSVYKLYKIFYNKEIIDILPSPSKYELKMYGGELGLDNYQKEIKRINDINNKSSI